MRPVTVIFSGMIEKLSEIMKKTLENTGLVEEIVQSLTPFNLSKTLNQILERVKTEYLLFIDGKNKVQIDHHGLLKMLSEAKSKKAGLVYSDFYEIEKGKKTLHPLIDYQLGSVRDDFDFGEIMFFSHKAIKDAISRYGKIFETQHGAIYDLRLKVSIDHPVYHIREPLYTVSGKNSYYTEGEQFNYVKRENLGIQKEMEAIFTDYLKNIGAFIPPDRLKYTEKTYKTYPVEATVVIPVKDRSSTIAQAVKSALSQETDFSFNIIVVDNHSEDGTTEIIERFSKKYRKIIHIIPGRKDLEIGGCWNEAIYSPHCGKYAVQLDSDDIYSSPYTLKRIVDMLREYGFAMVVGSYRLVDFQLNDIPFGIIDHREWSSENGHNNLLRVNGIGAPRAYNTEIIRSIGFLNVSYGEDYHMALRISREYKIGRIYDCLYLCRRWEKNTDSHLTMERLNANNQFKDKLRTDEIMERQKIVKIQ